MDTLGDGAAAGRVVVVGSINVDLVVRSPALPGPGETVVGGTFERHGGGKSANQAVAAARAGAPTWMVGAVGNDDEGGAAVAELAAEGIDVSEVRELDGVRTGVALIVVDPDGENQIAVASGANGGLTPIHVRDALGRIGIGPGDICLLAFEIPMTTVVAAAEVATRAGAMVIVNPAPAAAIADNLYELAPILTPNEGEAQALTGLTDVGAAAAALAARTGRAVIVTLGARGALLVQDGTWESREIPAYRAVPIDTTGAGDTFNGTLAAGLAAGLAMAEAADRANVAAGLATESAGARTGPSRDAVDAAIAR